MSQAPPGHPASDVQSCPAFVPPLQVLRQLPPGQSEFCRHSVPGGAVPPMQRPWELPPQVCEAWALRTKGDPAETPTVRVGSRASLLSAAGLTPPPSLIGIWTRQPPPL